MTDTWRAQQRIKQDAGESERFVSPCKPPEGRVRELLTILMEEAAEATQRASKALRFGVEEVQPGQPLDNSARLAEEIGDFMGVVCLLEEAKVIDPQAVIKATMAKKRKLAKWLQSEAQP